MQGFISISNCKHNLTETKKQGKKICFNEN